jgi:hypothetical protein
VRRSVYDSATITAETLFDFLRRTKSCWLSKIGVSRVLALAWDLNTIEHLPYTFAEAFAGEGEKISLDQVLSHLPRYSKIELAKNNLALGLQTGLPSLPQELGEGPKFRVLSAFIDFRDLLLQLRLQNDNLDKPGFSDKDIATLMHQVTKE